MKIKIEDASALPEGLRDAVSEGEGGHELDLSQLAPVGEVERFKAKALKAEGEAIDRRKALKSWEALGESPADVQAAIAKAGEAGDSEKIIAQIREASAAKETELTGRIKSILTNQAQAQLRAELAKAGVIPDGLDFAAQALSGRVNISDDDTIRIVAADGKTPMVGAGENGGAVLADLAKEFATSMPQLVADGGKSGGGKPPGDGGKPGKLEGRAGAIASKVPGFADLPQK